MATITVSPRHDCRWSKVDCPVCSPDLHGCCGCLPKALSDPDEATWARLEMKQHPEGPTSKILAAVALVHDLHLRGGCS